MQRVARSVPPSTDRLIAALWAVTALAVVLSFAVAYLRVRRARIRWPMVELHGSRVRVSPVLGPIVIGVARPEIIIPRWLVDRTLEEQRLVVEHEAAHVDARDPLLLVAGCVLAALMPWNPVLWIMLSRLRLAIELDCDARVLRRGRSPRLYGMLLIDVAERARPLRFAALALSDAASQLQKRILAMESRRITHPFARGAGVILVGLAGLLAACEATVPTAADIQHMDASSAERSAKGLMLADTAEIWLVDGKVTSAAAAKGIPADSIATINVTGLAGTRTITMHVNTIGHADDAARTNERTPTLVFQPHPGDSIRTGAIVVRGSAQDEPLLIIDGKRAAFSALKTLDRAKIDNVEVLKGAAAIAEYGAAADHGVVVVRTKS